MCCKVRLPCRVLLLLDAFSSATVVEVHVDTTSAERTYDGHGALSAGASSRLLFDYAEPQRSHVLDYLFKPGFGASLHHLKVEIGGDTWSTDGSEPSHKQTRQDLNFNRGYEMWLLKEAKRRNPGIITYGLPWGTPGWVGNGDFYSFDNIYNYTLPWLDGARHVHGVTIDFVGIWNEKAITNLNYVKELRHALDTHGYRRTGIVVSDNALGGTTAVEKAMLSDPVLNASVEVVGLHYPRGHPDPLALALGKKLWASESLTTSADWAGTSLWARTLNQNFVRMNATSAIAWSLIWSAYPSLICTDHGLMDAWEPWSGSYRVAQQVWATAHTTMFTKPGWLYAPQGAGAGLFADGAGSYVSFVDKSTGKASHITIVVEFMGKGGSDTLELAFSIEVPAKKLKLWVTNRTVSMLPLPDVPVLGRVVTLRVDRWHLYTLTTLTLDPAMIGGGNVIRDGGVATPASGSFPIPYNDSFDSSVRGVDKPGWYFSDQEGTFAVAEEIGANGNRVLQQQSTWNPIRWGNVGDPSTIIGPYFQNYRVRINARIPVRDRAFRDRRDVAMFDCAKDAEASRWDLHQDGTVRPKTNGSRCLTSMGGQGEKLFTAKCVAGDTRQSWAYNSTAFPNHFQWMGSLGRAMCVDYNQRSQSLDLYECCCDTCCCGCETFSFQQGGLWKDGGIAGGKKCVVEQQVHDDVTDQYVSLCGRLGQPAGGFGFSTSTALCIIVYSSGFWSLAQDGVSLRNGTLGMGTLQGKWLFMALEFRKDSAHVLVGQSDAAGVEFTQVLGHGSDHGLIALRSGRHLAEFDNFGIDYLREYAAPSSHAFAHSVFHGGARRQDFDGAVGFAVDVLRKSSVVALGRFRCAGDKRNHTLSLVRASDGAALQSIVIDMNSATVDAAGFAYAALASPMTLFAGVRYYIVSSEDKGGDCWYGSYTDSCGGQSGGLPLYFTNQKGPVVLSGGVSSMGKLWVEDASEKWLQETRRGYGPVNFIYDSQLNEPEFALMI